MRPRFTTIGAAQVLALPCCADGCPRPMTAETLGWADAAVQDWGACGVAVRRSDRVLGYLLIAPARSAPVGGVSSATPVSSDAAVVTKLWVEPDARGSGVERQLVQAAAGFAQERRIPALEAVGTYGPGNCGVRPVRWLRRHGFHLIRNHPLHPLLRLDLSSTAGVLWWDGGWRRIAALLQRPHPVEPATHPWRTSTPPHTRVGDTSPARPAPTERSGDRAGEPGVVVSPPAPVPAGTPGTRQP